jgi:hypothetical protein
MMAVNDSWEFRVISYGENQLGEFVLHAIEGVSLGLGATKQQIVDAVAGTWSSIMIPWLPTTFSYRGATGAVYSPPGNVTNPLVSTIGQGSGTGTGVAPKQLAGLLALKSALVGRRGQGRVYLPFPSASMVSAAGVPSTAAATLLTVAKGLMEGPIGAGSSGNTTALFYSVRSRKFASSGVVVQATPRLQFATQRRRGFFGKVNAMPF